MNIEINNQEEQKIPKINILNTINERLVNEILHIIDKTLPDNFSDEVRFDKEEIEDLLKNQENITLVLEINKNIIGFAIYKPYNDAVKELQNYDTGISETNEKKYYEEIICVSPEYQKRGYSIDLFKKAVEILKERGINKLALHIRSRRGGHDKLIGNFSKNISKIRTMPNWLNSGESFDYLEIAI